MIRAQYPKPSPWRSRKRDGILSECGWQRQVCLSCRRAWGRGGRKRICPVCKAPLVQTNYRTRLPRKRNVRGWRRFATQSASC